MQEPKLETKDLQGSFVSSFGSASVTDPYVRNFWTKVYPTYPKDAHIQ